MNKGHYGNASVGGRRLYSHSPQQQQQESGSTSGAPPLTMMRLVTFSFDMQ